MLLIEDIEVSWNPANRKHYESLGYIFTYKGDTFKVKSNELTKGTETLVTVQCDFCGEKFKKPYKKYLSHRQINQKDCCNKRECKDKKKAESILIKYGVDHYSKTDEYKIKFKETSLKNWGTEHPMKSDEGKEKVKNVFLEKYGVETPFELENVKEKIQQTFDEKYNGHPSGNKDIIQKRKNTNIKKYGVEWNLQSEYIKEKSKRTNLEKYGVEYIMQSEEIKGKTKKNLIDKYGVENVSQIPEVKEKVKQTNLERYGVEQTFQFEQFNQKRIETWINKYGETSPMKNIKVKQKAIRTLYENGTAPTSTQQLHIHRLIGGELNYPFSNCMIDIAFPDRMIALEYDGGGHDLQVKYGNLTEEEFTDKDTKREMFLRSKGWKIIRIVSPDDNLPDDDELIRLIDIAFAYLTETEHTWFTIDLDNMVFKCSQYEKSF